VLRGNALAGQAIAGAAAPSAVVGPSLYHNLRIPSEQSVKAAAMAAFTADNGYPLWAALVSG